MNSLDFFEIHFAHAPFSIQLLSPEGKTLAVNRAWKDLWKIPEETIQNYILTEYNVATDPQLDMKGIGSLVRLGLTGKNVEIPPILYDPKDTGMTGDPKWVSGYMYPVKDSDGKLIHVVLTHQNITERKIAEDELRKSRDQLEIIFEGVLDGILVQNNSFKPVYANEAAAKICGFESAKDLCTVTASELAKKFDLPSQRALSGEGPQKDVAMRTKDLTTGQERWSLVSSTPIYDDNGVPYLAVTILRDITEQKQQQDRKTFLNEATNILSTSLDYNETLNKIAKLAVPRIADKCSINIFEVEESTTQIAQLQPRSMIVPIMLNEMIIGYISFISAESGRIFQEADFEMAKELSERSAFALENALLYQKSEKLTHELQKAVKARDEFISICSHELKTPITSMKLQFQMSERAIKAGDASAVSQQNTEKLISTANRQLDRMVKLIDEMLDVSRVTSDKLEMEFVKLDFKDLVGETLSGFSNQFETHQIKLKVNLGNENCYIKGDRFRLEQVISNIMTNALKYGASNPIDVKLVHTQKSCRLEIADQGIGISPYDLERIFDRFERVASDTNISGLGLGLFISKQIVLAHHGKIWAKSNTSKGTTFFVELPLA